MSILKRIVRSEAGNVLYMTALVVLPILGMIGGGIDLGRAYMAQNRLQNACDAGVLAARKTQTSNNIDNDSSAQESAENFFDHNFGDGLFGVTTTEDTFVVTRGDTATSTSATASIEVDTVIMNIFGFESIPIDVDCSADIDAENTDVMMVLDLTLSMNGSLNGVKKIDSLKSAVRNFYDIVQAGAVTGRNRIRYGFVPYAGTVNVGDILMDENPSYVVGGDTSLDTEWTYHTRTWNGSSYDVGHKDLDVTDYVASIDTAEPVTQIPGRETATNSPRWDGCIEERKTEHITTSLFGIPSGALDMDIDLVPNDDIDTRWKPHWRDVVRRNNGNSSGRDNCPPPSRKLAEYADYDDGSSNSLSDYINGMTLAYATDQVVGLTWGARFLSETGLFAAENDTAPNGQPINRHVVFMTDGKLYIDDDVYSAWGMHEADGRMGNVSINRTGTNGLNSLGYIRMNLICDAIKAKGITIWTVEFENDSTVSSSLLDCASSPDHAFPASNDVELNAAFGSIAQSISGLRLL